MHVVVGHRDLAAPDAPGQLGALLDDQGVRRDVVGSGAERGVEGGPPVVVGLAGGAVDQVEVDVVESGGAGLGDAGLGAAWGVRAVQDLQDVLPRALHAEGDPVEAALAEGGQVGGVDRLGVGLRRHLRVRRQAELVADRAQHPHQVTGGQQGGGAAADEDRADLARVVAEHLAGQADLVDECPGVVVAGGEDAAGAAQLGRGVGVEVAVAAAGRAVRHVQVEAEGAVGGPGERGRGQGTVGGDGFAVGECGGHAFHCPARERLPVLRPLGPRTTRPATPRPSATRPGAPAAPGRPRGAGARTRAPGAGCAQRPVRRQGPRTRRRPRRARPRRRTVGSRCAAR